MSQNAHDAGHESLIKTPKQLIITVVLAFVVPILLIVMISQFVANIRSVDMSSSAMTPNAVAKRLKPVADVAFAESGASAPAGPRSGEDVYNSVCSACHASGAAGAPKLGDEGAWAARLKQGEQALLASALKGKGAMPPRGGGANLSDLEVERAMVYMANKAGAKFNEPAAPAPEKAAVAAAAPETAAAAAPASASDKIDGKKIYDTTCMACHATGVAGAPKAGDKAAWAPRLKTGMNALYANALKGKGAMPPKGGNAALADAEVKAAVDYLAGLAK
ncbi:MAG: cytochrome c5 family protein [Burkholderiales bacterium]|nr:cytochrome c5 family protein [Burkholderiales bacterium]